MLWKMSRDGRAPWRGSSRRRRRGAHHLCLINKYMLTKNDLSVEEWNALRDVPHWVGFAMLLAGSSGLGTIKEFVALAKGILEGQSSDVPLIRDMTTQAEVQGAELSVRGSLGGPDTKVSKDRMKSIALERVTAALSVLRAKGSADEVSAFRQWLYSIAEQVAKAAKEGGFLGFGGTQVS